MASMDGGVSGVESPRSEFACIFCKKRKVKCDRSLPFCKICNKSRQSCVYPVEAGRPGPKLGSTRGRRKRPRSVTPESIEVRSRNEEGTPPLDTDTINRKKPNSQTTLNVSGQSPAEMTESYPLTPATTPLDVQTLAYIVHPSHEVAEITPPRKESLNMTDGQINVGSSYLVTQACSLLGISIEAMHTYIKLYFDKMTAFSIFHHPSFTSKVQSATSPKELAALLASMFSFSSRFDTRSEQDHYPQNHESQIPIQESHHSPSYFQALAQKYVDEELLEYSDGPPTLCLLQALILVTFLQLTTGVRGAAWRRLGLCIRTAYELQLHQVDLNQYVEMSDVGAWCAVEERRRAWWAIWEMDVFASTIKRCPSAIDRLNNETRLPAPDENWYEGKVFRSCFLEEKPMERVSALRETKNQSVKAWYLVLNSFMYDGHVMSKYRSARPGNGRHGPSKGSLKKAVKDVSEGLIILANALKCFSLALPGALRYRDEFLTFASRDPSEVATARRLHSAKYSIHVMTQLTRFMIHHHDAYSGAVKDLRLAGAINEDNGDSAGPVCETLSLHLGPTRKGLQEYMDAADELLAVVSRSSEDHARFVNPFLASTIWYGAAIHLTWTVLAPLDLNRDIIHSKYEVLRMSFEEYAAFWNLPKALEENLKTLERKLRPFTSRGGDAAAPAKSRGHSKLKKATTGSANHMNFEADIRGAEARNNDRGDDLQFPHGPSSENGICPSQLPVMGMDGAEWQSPLSRDAFNFDNMVISDDSGQIEAPYMGPGNLGSGNLWLDLGLGLDFPMEGQNLNHDFTNYNYADI